MSQKTNVEMAQRIGKVGLNFEQVLGPEATVCQCNTVLPTRLCY